MRNIFRKAEQSIIAKLTIAVGLLMVTVSFLFWYAILYKQEKDIMSIAVKYGTSFIDFVKESTRYSMLTRHRSDIQQTLEGISAADGVDRVRIFDHSGKIFYSTSREDIGNFVNKTSIACNGCHSDKGKSFKLLSKPEKWDTYIKGDGVTTLKLVEPVYNEPACYTADCHAHTEEQKILGFVEADTSLALLDEARLKQGLALTAYLLIFFLILSVSIVMILWRIISKPVRKLVYGIERVAAGDLDYTVEIRSRDELGMLAETLNRMTKDIKAVRDREKAWTQELEAEVSKKAGDIQKTHDSLLKTEKLASLGRMAAGIAHELHNPFEEVLSSAHSIKRRLPPESDKAEDIDTIIEQTERSEKIISNFHNFANAKPAEKGKVDINDLLNRTVFILKGQKKFRNIRININTEDIPVIRLGDVSQFQQIFLNMLINSADAMIDEKGSITVTTRKITEDNKDYVEIEFTDTGCGIKEEDIPKLFEPFFTTKPGKDGTGIGLSVCHGIVRHLGGDIRVRSRIGKGSTFFVRLPLTEQNTN